MKLERSHSLEVAVAASSVRGLEPSERDLVIVYALLHDIGKLWSYHEGHLTTEAAHLGHERVGHAHLAPMLAALHAEAPELGVRMEALLRGDWKRDHRNPVAAL